MRLELRLRLRLGFGLSWVGLSWVGLEKSELDWWGMA